MAPDKQAVQARAGYLASGQRFEVEKTFSMRTATDRVGRASEGLLFGYQAIRAGQRFGARIDTDIPEMAGIVDSWLKTGSLHLGRSRSAEFGAVRVEKLAAPPPTISHGLRPNATDVVGYCHSDLCLRNPETGAATLLPQPAHFPGMPPSAVFDPMRSYLRTRAYSPFNGKRRRPDLERQVIEAGSVILFKAVDAFDSQALESSAARGYGELVEEGLGAVLWNPAFLEPPERLAYLPATTSAADVQVPDDELGRYVTRQVQASERNDALEKLLTPLVNSLRRFRLPPSQWGVIRNIGRASGSFESVYAEVTEQTRAGISGQMIWTRKIGTTSAAALLDEALKRLKDSHGDDAGAVLERLAARMLRENRGMENG